MTTRSEGNEVSGTPGATISVVVPALDEEACLAETLRSVKAADERIVVDGGSQDRTREIAATEGARLLSCEACRGRQLDVGARAARGDWLLFLHADTRLDPGWRDAALRLPPEAAAGVFRLTIDAAGRGYRLLEAMVVFRTRVLGRPFGDQGLLVRRAAYEKVGGFAPIPLMEDVELTSRLRKLGRLGLLGSRAVTSPRRWQRHGLVGTTLRNWSTQALFALGVSPERLARRYRSR